MNRAKNQMTREQAQERVQELKMHWREWEKAIEKLFRVNSHRWHWWHIPRLPTRQLNKRMPRKLPDFVAVGKVGSNCEGRILVIEAKTGGATQDKEQAAVMKAFLKVNGVEGGVFYPLQRAVLVRLIGDEAIG